MFLFGGEFPGGDFVARFYSIHVLLLPGIMLGLLVAHLILVFYHKHTQFAGPGKTNKNVVGMPLLPVYMAKAGGFFFLVFGVIAVIAAHRLDQPDLGARPLPSGPGVHRRPARLVHGLLRGPDPRHAGLGDQPLGSHARPGCVHPADDLPAGAGRRSRSTRSSSPGSPATSASTTSWTARATPRPVRPSASPGSPAYIVLLIGGGNDLVGHALPPVDQRDHLVRADRLLRRPGPRVHRHQADLPRPPAPRQGQGAARPRVRHHQAPAAR